MIARRDPGGMVTVPARPYIVIPAALRRRSGLRAGDHVLLAARARPGSAGRLLLRGGGPGDAGACPVPARRWETDMTARSSAASRQAVVDAALVLRERMGLTPADLAAGRRHHAPDRRGGVRGVRAAGLAGPRLSDQRPDARVRQVVGDQLVRARYGRVGRLPPDGPGWDGTGAVARSRPSCPACRSWSWAWGPLWRTCCGPTPSPRMHGIPGPDHQLPCGPWPGPPRTRAGQAAHDRSRTGTGPRAGSRTARGRTHSAAVESRNLASAPPGRRRIRPAMSPAGLPQREAGVTASIAQLRSQGLERRAERPGMRDQQRDGRCSAATCSS
jgi:hypothetical protein